MFPLFVYQKQVLDFLEKILELVYCEMCIHMLFRMLKHCSSDAFCCNSLTFITLSNIISGFFVVVVYLFVFMFLRFEILF